MSDHESLYREMAERERDEDRRYLQNLAPKIVKVTPKPVDYNAALRRFNEDFKPMFGRREKARTSKAYRLFLKATGQWPKEGLDGAEVVSPTKGLKQEGPTVDEVRDAIAANPSAFKDLMKMPETVTPRQAERREIRPTGEGDK